MKRPSLALTVLIGGPGRAPTVVTGREAWALSHLVLAGERGVTPLDTPGPRWGHYAFLLRRRGIAVETVHEAHGGPFPGHHARYNLRGAVAILHEERAA